MSSPATGDDALASCAQRDGLRPGGRRHLRRHRRSRNKKEEKGGYHLRHALCCLENAKMSCFRSSLGGGVGSKVQVSKVGLG